MSNKNRDTESIDVNVEGGVLDLLTKEVEKILRRI